ncbi:MAG: hypothetical protein CMJ19_12975 [Phycisphaeraceae bacterium]|nr:hypothetical protein [Phycisphaeraceae bacterium]
MAIVLFPVILFFIVFAIVRVFSGKGKPQLSEPYCAKCGYDLRVNWDSSMVCPECGADLKAKGAVNFGTMKKSRTWVTVAITVAVLLLTFLLMAGVTLPIRRNTNPAALSKLTNNNLIVNLPTRIDEPWTWQELEARYKSGQLSDQEVDEMLAELINGLKFKPIAERGPIHWATNFLQKLIDDKKISPARYAQLMKVYFGPGPTKFHPITSKMQPNWSAIYASFTQPWSLGSTDKTKPHCRLVSVVVKGDEDTPLLFVPEAQTHWQFEQVVKLDSLPITFSSGSRICLRNTLEPGEHVLLLKFVTELYPELGPMEKPSETDKPLASYTHVQPLKVTVDDSGRIICEKLTILR